MEQNQNQNIENGENFDSSKYREDLSNLSARYNQEQNSSAPALNNSGNDNINNNNNNISNSDNLSTISNASGDTNTSNNNNNKTATIVTVQVPVAVPVQVPIPVQVPVAVPVKVPVAVPVYVPVAVPALESTKVEQQLKEQQQQQQQQQQSQQYSQQYWTQNENIQEEKLPQTSNYNPLSSDVNNNENKEDLLNVSYNDIKENINSGIEQVKNTLNNVIETGKDRLGFNNVKVEEENEKTIKKPESAVFGEAKAPLVSQALEEEDKKSVEDTYVSPKLNEKLKKDIANFDINLLHDVKKQHKETKVYNNSGGMFNNIINQAKDTLNSGVETIKNNLGLNNNNETLNKPLFIQEKQPLISQPLEKEDRKDVNYINMDKDQSSTNANGNNDFDVSLMYNIKKDKTENENQNENNESRINNMMNQAKETLNSGVETLKDTLRFNKSNDNNKPEEAVFNQEKQILMNQPLEKEDKKDVNYVNMDKSGTNDNNNNNIIINEMYDVKKEHKDNKYNNQIESESRLNETIDRAKDTLNSGMESIKDRLGFNNNNNNETSSKPLFVQEKQPLVSQALEKEDRKDVNNINMDNKQEDRITKFDNDVDFRNEQPLNLQANIAQEDTKLDNTNFSSDNDRKITVTREELTPLISNEDRNTYGSSNISIDNRNERTRSYADVASSENKMVAGDTKAFKDITSSAFDSNTADVNTLSQPLLNDTRDREQFEATKKSIPSQNDAAPQINDTSA